MAAASAALKLDAGIPIDYDHAIDFAAPEGRPAPAAGWIKELEAREGALWGRVEWTEHGAAALATKEYRYISPVFEHDEGGVVLRLLRAALTNNPNLYLKAIAARGAGMDSQKSELSNEPASADAVIAVLREVLEMGAEATVEEMVAALRDVVGRKTGSARAATVADEPPPAEKAEYVAAEALERARAELRAVEAREAAGRVERAVGAALQDGRIVPAQREWALQYCARDYEGFAAFAARQPRLRLGEIGVERDTAPVYRGRIESSAREGAELGAVERAVCARLGISASAYAARKAARESEQCGVL